MVFVKIVLILVLCKTVRSECVGKSRLVCMDDDYDKTELPEKYSPTPVTVSVHVDEVLEINDQESSLSISGYFNVGWADQRLGTDKMTSGASQLMDIELLGEIWKPDIYIYNLLAFEEETLQSTITRVEKKDKQLYMDKMRNIFLQQKVKLKINCPMDLSMFPFDRHTCKLRVGSYSNNDSKMKFRTEDVGGNTQSGANKINFDVCKLSNNEH